ncbi:MBL fold metallo-hydrolase [Nocardia asiatica]|uniref:MBL fold metallo-hydrolase n=1 Tax=Nocardia asiatica TaxID=209252 RepID=UPI00245662E7|nr:MBL fold metallo-hydrolase [Nocardia asiatica]
MHTDLVNWVVLADADGVTLIDTGYPGHYRSVVDSIEAIGQPLTAVKAILLTHAHIDHQECAHRLATELDIPVFAHADELAHARRDAHHGLTPVGLLADLWRPTVLKWFERLAVTAPRIPLIGRAALSPHK